MSSERPVVYVLAESSMREERERLMAPVLRRVVATFTPEGVELAVQYGPGGRREV